MGRSVKRSIAVVASLGLLAVACGGDDDSSNDSAGGDDTAATVATDSADETNESSGGDDASSDSIETLEIMSRWPAGSNEAAGFEAVTAKFTEATGIAVDVIDAEEDLDVTYETSFAAGQEPHLVVINLFDKSIAWLESGATVDVASYIGEWGLEEVVDSSTIAEWTNDAGQVQGFPYSGFAWPVWYNTALLAEVGVESVPTTIDELKTAAEALNAAGVAPMVVGGSDWSGQKLFSQIAQSYVDRDTARSLFENGGWCDNPDAFRGIELFADLLDSGLFIDDVEGYSADLMNETFYAGDAAIMSAGSWAFDAAPEELRASIQLGGFPIPADSAFANPTVFQGFTGVGFMVSPKGEEEALDAIRELVLLMYEEENYSFFVTNSNVVPTIQLEDTSVATNELLQGVLSADYNGATELALLPDVYVPAPSNDGFGQAIALAYTGASADDICSNLDAAY